MHRESFIGCTRYKLTLDGKVFEVRSYHVSPERWLKIALPYNQHLNTYRYELRRKFKVKAIK